MIFRDCNISVRFTTFTSTLNSIFVYDEVSGMDKTVQDIEVFIFMNNKETSL